MGRSLFLLVISMILGVINCSNVLMAADNVRPKSPVFTDPQTVEIHEEVTEAQPPVATTTVYPVYTAPTYTAPVYTAPVYAAPANNITIAGRTIPIVDVANTEVDAGNHVNRYGEKFLYGHNSAGVFGPIVNLGVGVTFSVTISGVTKNYIVAKTEIFEKDPTTKYLQYHGSGDFSGVVTNAAFRGTYDIALMTCAGGVLWQWRRVTSVCDFCKSNLGVH